MKTVNMEDWAYEYLVKIMTKHFYETTDMNELFQINQVFHQLDYKAETWLSCLPE